jgi:membrane associated rhomboid family serine protease
VSDQADYSGCTEAELLSIFTSIDARRAGADFARLRAALEAHGYVVTVPASGRAELALADATPRRGLCVSIRFGPRAGPLGWLEPARNDFRFVGKGSLQVDQATVEIAGWRLTPLATIPLACTVVLDRERIVNVEVIAREVRFEYQGWDGRRRTLCFTVETGGIAERLVRLLLPVRTPDFKPQLLVEQQFEARIERRAAWAPVTLILFVLNLLSIVLLLISLLFLPTPGGQDLFGADGRVQIAFGSSFGPYTTDGEWWRILTALFVHLGPLAWVLDLWVLGRVAPLVERLYGSGRYLFIYLVAGAFGSLLSIYVHPEMRTAGAAGSILGIIGALAVLRFRSPEVPRTLTRARTATVVWFGIFALGEGFRAQGVDFVADLAGLITGVVLGLCLTRSGRELEPQFPHRGLAVSGLIAVVMLVVGGLAARYRGFAPNADGPFWREQHWIAQHAPSARWAMLRLAYARRTRQLRDSAVAQAIESQVLPVWTEAERRVQGISVRAGSPEATALHALQTLAANRRSASAACLAAARRHDAVAVDGCVRELEANNGAAHFQHSHLP